MGVRFIFCGVGRGEFLGQPVFFLILKGGENLNLQPCQGPMDAYGIQLNLTD